MARLSSVLLIFLCTFAWLDISKAQLSNLETYSQSCYTTFNLCFISADRDGQFGCGICDQDTVRFAPYKSIETEEALVEFLDNPNAPEKESILITTDLFVIPSVMNQIREKPQNILAVYVEQNSNAEDVSFPSGIGFSPTVTSPNSEFSSDPSRSYDWNPNGNALRQELFPVPIYALPPDVIRSVAGNVTRFDSDSFPRVELQPGGIMWACRQDAQTCLEKGTCQGIGGHSIWTAGSTLQDSAGKEFVAISSKFDSTGFFPDAGNGAWEATGAVAMIAAADAFFTYKRGSEDPLIRNPVFLGFFGESYGYTGSDRFLLDVQEFTCEQEADFNANQGFGCVDPYTPSLRFLNFREGSWKSHIHVGPVGSDSTVYAHTDGQQSAETLGELEAILRRSFGESGIMFDKSFDEQAGLPPSSSNSFIKRYPDVPSITLTDYEQDFNFDFYQSMFDSTNYSPAWLENTCKAGESLTRTIIESTYDVDASEVFTGFFNCSLVEELYRCFTLVNFTECALAEEYLPKDWFSVLVAFYDFADFSQSYASVFAPLPVTERQLPTRLARQSLMRYYLSFIASEETNNEACESDSDCSEYMEQINADVSNKAEWREVICAKSLCIVTESYYHQAYGTGLTPLDPGLNTFSVDNSTNPVFTESRWGGRRDGVIGYCIKTFDSDRYAKGIISAGVMVWVATAILLLIGTMFLRGKVPEDVDPSLFTE